MKHKSEQGVYVGVKGNSVCVAESKRRLAEEMGISEGSMKKFRHDTNERQEICGWHVSYCVVMKNRSRGKLMPGNLIK